MSYVFKNLDEIAALLEKSASDAEARGEASEDGIYHAVCSGQSSGLKNAANILRRTTITEPIHMEKQ